VNQIFASQNAIDLEREKENKFLDKLRTDYFFNPDWKAVVGCSTMNSIAKMPELNNKLFGT